MNESGLDNINLLLSKIKENHLINGKMIMDKNIDRICICMNKETIVPLYKFIADIRKEYYFSEYYHILCELNINTPKSVILNANDDFKHVDNVIKLFSNEQVFARLDICSSKPEYPYTCMKDIMNDMLLSDRTKDYIKEKDHKLILREYIDFTNWNEIRCFVEQSKLRGISGDNDGKAPFQTMLNIIDNIVKKIIFYCEYENCTIDIMINDNNEYMVIEINTPCYICATSGLFNLSINYDKEILFGKYDEEHITYPVLRFN
jgi:hypothetical protein